MTPDISSVRIEKRQNRAQILAFAFLESLEEGLFCRSPVIHEVVLDPPYPSDLTLRRIPPALLLPRGPRPPSVSSAFCGRRAAACRGRSGWCPCAWRPPRWASPPVSPPPLPLAAYLSVLRRSCGATLPVPCSATPAVRRLNEGRLARGPPPHAERTGPAAIRRATACA